MGHSGVLLLLSATLVHVLASEFFGKSRTESMTELASRIVILNETATVTFNTDHEYDLTIERVEVFHWDKAKVRITSGGVNEHEIGVEITPERKRPNGVSFAFHVLGRWAPGKQATTDTSDIKVIEKKKKH